jgi:hypothetical protein
VVAAKGAVVDTVVGITAVRIMVAGITAVDREARVGKVADRVAVADVAAIGHPVENAESQHPKVGSQRERKSANNP